MYNTNQKIQASDLNYFLNTRAVSFNQLWSTGAGNYGFGQTTIPAVAQGQKITLGNSQVASGVGATDTTSPNYGGWPALIDGMRILAEHTGATVTTVPTPAYKNKVAFFNAIDTNLNLIDAARNNATDQGGTSYFQATCPVRWQDKVQFRFVIALGTHDQARYFFNAGGQIKVASAHPLSKNINRLIYTLAVAMGEVWISGPAGGTVNISGADWRGVERFNGTDDAGTVINNNAGFHSLNSTPTEIVNQKVVASYAYDGYETNTFSAIQVSYDGAGNVTVDVIFDEVPTSGTGTARVSAGTMANITIRPPTSNILPARTWVATPTVTSTYEIDSNGAPVVVTT
jgi:hypothetical protein